MIPRLASYALAAAVVASGAFALFHTSATPPASSDEPSPTVAPSPATNPQPPEGVLPPNHPPIGGMGNSQGSSDPMPSPNTEDAAIRWTVPESWQSVASPSSMRIATYRIRPAPGDTDGAEVSVARAGGSKEANIQRWIGQFDDAGKDTREEKTVRGLKVTIVTVSGTYQGGGMMAGAATPAHAKWALLAAIVETPGMPYFFKLTGPLATAKAARSAFDTMIASITPS